VGLHRPCVGLYGPTDPAAVGPWGVEDAVVRGADASTLSRRRFRDPRLGDALMRLIRPADVLDRADLVLGRPAPAAPDGTGTPPERTAPLPERAAS
jgi:hypothetical protein